MSPASIGRIVAATALLGIAAAVQSCTRQAATTQTSESGKKDSRQNESATGTGEFAKSPTGKTLTISGATPPPMASIQQHHAPAEARMYYAAESQDSYAAEPKSGAAPQISHGDVWRVKNGAPNAPMVWINPGDSSNYPGDRYSRVDDTPFKAAMVDPLSTFSIDVDTASYTNVQRYLDSGTMPPPDAVRIEECINYFRYDYPEPTGPHPVSVTVDGGPCPWEPDHKLVRIGLKGKELTTTERPPTNLVFLVDTSGSMNPADRLPMLKSALPLMVEQLSAQDTVSIVTYAGGTQVVLNPTRGSDHTTINSAFANLGAGGSTAGASGIQLAYECAQKGFIRGGNNRIILCTDGDFNVGVSNTGELTRMAEERAKDTGVYLSVIGVGRGNLNDEMLEEITNRGNGTYYYAGSPEDARKILLEDLAGTLYTIAKDVKVQVEFNPALVQAFRLVGYENRRLAHEDFNDDSKDAGDMGAGYTVTALYEIVPTGVEMGDAIPPVDPLKYSYTVEPLENAAAEWLTVKVRYQQPEGSKSELLEVALASMANEFFHCDDDFLFAASVANFGMLLRGHSGSGAMDYEDTVGMIETALLDEKPDDRMQFLQSVRKTSELSGKVRETSMRNARP